jgi:hypothetical protein
MSYGYLYCMSNPSMPGLLKIGYTERTIEDRLQEANIGGTWCPPTSYEVELSKFVKDVQKKERILHKLLQEKRVHPGREFFRVPLETVRLFFDLMDGAEYKPELCKKEDIYSSFLNEVIYPLEEEEVNFIDWGVIASAFSHWKTKRGSNRGDVMVLKKTMEEVFGKLEKGTWNSKFKLKTDLNKIDQYSITKCPNE